MAKTVWVYLIADMSLRGACLSRRSNPLAMSNLLFTGSYDPAKKETAIVGEIVCGKATCEMSFLPVWAGIALR
jgi:hypothetical protein